LQSLCLDVELIPLKKRPHSPPAAPPVLEGA
jgi:hypothetical protein